MECGCPSAILIAMPNACAPQGLSEVLYGYLNISLVAMKLFFSFIESYLEEIKPIQRRGITFTLFLFLEQIIAYFNAVGKIEDFSDVSL